MERFTKEELEKWWHAQCSKCGWDGLSRDCAGGEPIADTGDFNDPLCPMCIKKDDYVVVDDYVEPDARATIAALQADNRTYVDERHEHMKQIEQLQSQLTQRTAELEAAKRDRDELQSVFDLGHTRTVEADKLWQEAHGKPEVWPDLGELVGWLMKRYDDLQAELERVRADNKALDEWRADVTVSLQRPGGAFFVDVPQHIKDIVKERDALRTLILALPKVEGEISELTACLAVRGHRVTYAMIAALLQHRQGMEG